MKSVRLQACLCCSVQPSASPRCTDASPETRLLPPHGSKAAALLGWEKHPWSMHGMSQSRAAWHPSGAADTHPRPCNTHQHPPPGTLSLRSKVAVDRYSSTQLNLGAATKKHRPTEPRATEPVPAFGSGQRQPIHRKEQEPTRAVVGQRGSTFLSLKFCPPPRCPLHTWVTCLVAAPNLHAVPYGGSKHQRGEGCRPLEKDTEQSLAARGMQDSPSRIMLTKQNGLVPLRCSQALSPDRSSAPSSLLSRGG